jgi:flagellar biosynthesis protein FlhF
MTAKAETFVASDMRQAMALVRQALGNDAMILSTKRVGGQTEIKAVAETVTPAEARKIQAAPTQPAAEKQAELSPVISSIQEEIGRLRMMFESELAQLSWREQGRHQPNRHALISRFEAAGVDRVQAAALVDPILPCADLEQAWSKALGLLGKKIKTYPKDILETGGIFAMVGSTGVGKTTTAAKIAARFALRHGRKHVAFVSTDRAKVGGQEQLVSFGSILGVPVQIATTREEMKRTLDSLSERKLVIIDTAGTSQRDMALADQFSALSIDAPIEPLLVLPATARASLIEETIKAFGRVNVAGAIMTKLDECDGVGPLLSCIVRHGLPLAFSTDGQQVPDDLHAIEPKMLLADIIKTWRQSLRKPQDNRPAQQG